VTAKLIQPLIGLDEGVGVRLSVDGEMHRIQRWSEALENGTFEEVYEALGEAVACLETGNLPLEEAIQCYEFGARLADRCGKILAEAELRVSQLDAELLANAVSPLTTEDELN
jgi:exodeoxyribonuclease VII small subunit